MCPEACVEGIADGRVDEGMSERQRDTQTTTRGQGDQSRRHTPWSGVATNEYSV